MAVSYEEQQDGQMAATEVAHPEHLMREARAGRFPRPLKTGRAANCAVRFVQEEVEAWLRDRLAERNNASA